MKSPIILALDTKDLATAKSWIEATKESIGVYKVGLEFCLKFGSQGLASLKNDFQIEVFLDLKLHDIPNTVGGAAKSVSALNPKFLTVHASGGSEMVSAAVLAAPHISITAVTILTSLSDEDLFKIGFANNARESAVSLAKLAVAAGAKSIVCSPFEVSDIRAAVPMEIDLITPGVRPVGVDAGDQKRVMTPYQALAAGANYLVIGRPITDLAKVSLEAMSAGAAKILSSIQYFQ